MHGNSVKTDDENSQLSYGMHSPPAAGGRRSLDDLFLCEDNDREESIKNNILKLMNNHIFLNQHDIIEQSFSACTSLIKYLFNSIS